MEISVKSDAKEIADLVYALQGQQNHERKPLEIIKEAIQQSIDAVAGEMVAT